MITNRKKISLFIWVVAMTFVALLLMKDRLFLFDKPVHLPLQFKSYHVSEADTLGAIDAPILPDISGYTLENIEKRKPAVEFGVVNITILDSILGMEKFTEQRRHVEFSRLQKRADPVTINIRSGVYDLESLTAVVGRPEYLEKTADGYLLKVPLYVERGAAMLIEGTPEKHINLKMSSVTGGFIVNSGNVFIIHADVSGWNDEANTYSTYQPNSEKEFRPFYATWSGSETYFYGSHFKDLGYHLSKSYGISFSSSKLFIKENPNIAPPKGWLVNNIFEGLYYGFYSYEARDIAIIGNTYKNNIIYGIDPHDRSTRLTIAKNIAYGSMKKHGIIVSREVNDSWIFDNICFLNHGSGFMLDRSSIRNVVANNYAFLNSNDGLTLFESQENLLYDNKMFANGKSGFRFRNSWDIIATKNWVMFNRDDGVQSYAFDITKTEKDRDFVMDPFTIKSSLRIHDDVILGNMNGDIKLNSFGNVTLSGIEYGFYRSNFMRGELDDIGRELAKGIQAHPNGLKIDFIKSSAMADAAVSDETINIPQKKHKNTSDSMGDLDEDGASEE